MTLALTPILGSLGPLALVLMIGIVFAETGLMVGFFLPGDSMLFAGGLFVAAGAIPLPLWLMVLGTWLAAMAGDQVAYLLGHRFGPGLFSRRPTRLWSPRHVEAARAFFERHGHKAVVLARFVPLARTFTPVVAGAVGMPRSRFSLYNVVGGLAWTASVLLAGYFLGGIPLVAAHVELFMAAMVVVSLVPTAWAARRGRRARARARSRARSGCLRVGEPRATP